MTPNPLVLISHPAGDLRDRLVGWVRRQGFATDVAADGRETLYHLRTQAVFASFLSDCSLADGGIEAQEGGAVWRVVHQIVGRRLVLMARERRNDLWFEALGAGVGAVLPLPAEERTVRAALMAVTLEDPRCRASSP